MERRKSGRMIVNLKAERISGRRRYDVFIEDISESGIHLITAPSATYKKYIPGTEIDVRLLLADGVRISLNCKIAWSVHRLPPEREVDNIGLEIIDPPLRYIEFIRTLSSAIG
ncbi:MAG: PilZ domain-containing protein [Dissulfurispiraceae bacterium]